MPDTACDCRADHPSQKFRDPDVTAKGEARAYVALSRLQTLWFNTGSLCNIACDNCYIDSSPRNDSLAYLTLADVRPWLDEAAARSPTVELIGFTGGEPFLNKAFPAILGATLARGFRALVLTNAMKPMQHARAPLLALQRDHAAALSLRVSIDHFEPAKHEAVRGAGSWQPMVEGLAWLVANGFAVSVASRTLWHAPEAVMRAGFAALFAELALPIDAEDPQALVLFPEMDIRTDVPEITTRCWSLLGVDPEAMMCATSRMVIRRRGEARTTLVPCTLLPYDPQFDLGGSLAMAPAVVKLNHPFCAQFCVLGGASCSSR